MFFSITSIIKFITIIYGGNLGLYLIQFRFDPRAFNICCLRILNRKLNLVYILLCGSYCRFTLSFIRTLLPLFYPRFIESQLSLVSFWGTATSILGADSFFLIKPLTFFASLTAISRLFSIANRFIMDFKWCLVFDNCHF